MIVDTNALSAWQEQDKAIRQLVGPGSTLVIPSIVLGEYRYGILRLGRREREAYGAWLDRVIRRTKIATVSRSTAEVYAIARVRLQQIGMQMASNDLWIAAIALEHRMPVLSRDTDFDRVDGLTRVSW